MAECTYNKGILGQEGGKPNERLLISTKKGRKKRNWEEYKGRNKKMGSM